MKKGIDIIECVSLCVSNVEGLERLIKSCLWYEKKRKEKIPRFFMT